FVYRFNLEKDPVSRNDVQAAGTTGPRDHTYLALGTFYFYGRTAQNVSGVLSDGVTPTVLTAREPFYRIGGDVNFNYRNLNVFGVYLAAHDHNVLPVTAPGAAGITGFSAGTPATFSGGFLEADYLALPWAMTIMRWDQVKSSADRSNFLQYDPTAPSDLNSSDIQRRLLRGRLPGPSLGDDHYALGPGKVQRRPHQLPSIRSNRASRIVVLLPLCSNAQPVHARGAVAYPRQHQGLCRIPDHAATSRLQPGNRCADQSTIPD